MKYHSLLFLLVIGAVIAGGCHFDPIVPNLNFPSDTSHFHANPDLGIIEIFANGATLTSNFDVPRKGVLFNISLDFDDVQFYGFLIKGGGYSTYDRGILLDNFTPSSHDAAMRYRLGNLTPGVHYQIQSFVVAFNTDTSFSPVQEFTVYDGPSHWVHVGDSPSGISQYQDEAYSFVIGSQVYTDIFPPPVYDAAKNTWSEPVNFYMNADKKNFTAVVGSKPYTRYANDFSIWDESAGTWYSNSTYYGDSCHAINPFVFAIGTTIYAGAGTSFPDSNSIPSKLVWQFQTSNNKWKRMPDLPVNFGDVVVSLAVGNKGYVVCKNSDTVSISKLQTWEFDPTAKTWKKKADAPFRAPEYYLSAILPQTAGTDKFYVYRDSTIWTYTPASNQWAVLSSEPTIMENSNPLLAWANGNLYFGFGEDYSPYHYTLNYLWEYIP